ncbi:MAG TPA: DUF2917 domain-containing protein [Usitatibacter sp.]|nr:DUF2917 domain-containing protein [Usitatibacter sp.]
MTLTLERPTLALEAGQVLALDDIAGTRISTRAGTVWVTYEDSRKDLILAPGDSLVVAQDGRTVVQALEAAFVTLQ